MTIGILHYIKARDEMYFNLGSMSPTPSEYVTLEPNLAYYKAISKKNKPTAKIQYHTAQLDHDESNIRHVWATINETLHKIKSIMSFRNISPLMVPWLQICMIAQIISTNFSLETALVYL